MRKIIFAFLLLTTLAARAAEVIDINQFWLFLRNDVSEAAEKTYDDTDWDAVNLPHTWNAFDGQDGGSNYYRGACWYRKHLDVSAIAAGKTVYLEFLAACTQTTVFVDGEEVGSHTGGYARFGFDITSHIAGKSSVILAVRVDNSASIIAPPLTADFTHFGGLTRGVRLLVKNPVQINPLEVVSSDYLNDDIQVFSDGVRISQTDVSHASATVNVAVDLRNAQSEPIQTDVVVSILDANDEVVVAQTVKKDLDAAETATATTQLTVSSPHLWNGKKDAYLYSLLVQVKKEGVVTDESTQPLGLRYYSVDKQKGFILNGEEYPLRGIAIHDEVKDKGRAVSDDDRRKDLDIMLETGANFLRLAHYQHGDFTYDYSDRNGIVLWTEIPVVDRIGDANTDESYYMAFEQNASQQLYELIYQLQNHPSICFWGLCNEIRNKEKGSDNTVRLVSHLNDLAHAADGSRKTTLAGNYLTTENTIPDLYSMNMYIGWYGAAIENFGSYIDSYQNNSKYPNPLGLSEYGAGANTAQHEYPASKPTTTGVWHPEEYQNAFHEAHLAAIKARPYIWESSIWAGFDFACDERNEGNQPGINDKGLVTRDRLTRKDSYYLYKANWNTLEPTLYITSRRFTTRYGTTVKVRVYTNCPNATLYIDGVEQETVEPNETGIVEFSDKDVSLGNHTFTVKGSFNGELCEDEVVWTFASDPTACEEGQLQINFGTSTTAEVEGYLKDDGSEYSLHANGYTYGWSADNTSNTRERGVYEDKRFDTHAMMKNFWSISLPDGNYRVSIGCGDPSYKDSYHVMTANGTEIIRFNPATDGLGNYKTGTSESVKVTGGRLVISNGTDADNSKMCFIHITNLDGKDLLNDDSEENEQIVMIRPTTRATVLKDAGQYMIFNTAVDNGKDDRTGFLYDNGTSLGHTGTARPNPSTFVVSDAKYVWTVHPLGDHLYDFKGVSGHLSINGKTNNAEVTNDLRIIRWDNLPNEKKAPNLASKDADGLVRLYGTYDDATDIWAITASDVKKTGTYDAWNGNATSWSRWHTAHPYAFYEIEAATLAQVNAYEELVAAVHSLVYPLQQSYGLVQDPTDYVSNRPETAASENSSYEHLLDDNAATYFHSSWSNAGTDAHYLQATLTEPVGDFFIYFMRRAENDNNTPLTITVQGSKDGVNFEDLETITMGLPKQSWEREFFSGKINGNNSTSLRLVVNETNSSKKWFTMSELYLLPSVTAVENISLAYEYLNEVSPFSSLADIAAVGSKIANIGSSETDETFSAVNGEGITLYYRITDRTNFQVEVSNPAGRQEGDDEDSEGWHWASKHEDASATYCSSGFSGMDKTVIIPSEVVNSNDGKTYTVTAVGNYAFIYAFDNTSEGMTFSVVLPEGVETIGENAFYAARLSEIILPSTLAVISANAFADCADLKEIVFPENLGSIGAKAFYRTGIKTFTLPFTSPIEVMDETFHCYDNATNTFFYPNIVVPTGCSKNYKTAEALCEKGWQIYQDNDCFREQVKIAAPAFATYFLEEAMQIPAGTTAYIVTGYDSGSGKLMLEERYPAGAVAPSQTALLLHGDADTYLYRANTDEAAVEELNEERSLATTFPDDNLLKGTLEDKVFGEDTKLSQSVKYYTMTYGQPTGSSAVVFGFFWDRNTADEGLTAKCAARKCVLMLPQSDYEALENKSDGGHAGVRGVGLDEVLYGSPTTAIHEAAHASGKSHIRDLSGRVVKSAKHGVFIQDGKLFLIP